MNTRRPATITSTSAKIVAAVLASLFSVSDVQAQIVVIDDFEAGEGHFTSNPNTGSGTSQGFLKTGTPATADQVFTQFFDGAASQQIVIFDDVNAGGVPTNPVDSWRLRNLSGGGTPASNLSLGVAVGQTSYVGYWLKTSSLGLEASIGIDDGALSALEIGRWQPIIADGEWHLYEWQFQNADDWNAFAGTVTNGTIDSATVTIDSLFFRAGVGTPTGTAFDATFFIDRVAYNPTASTIPEPASLLFLGASGCVLLGRRRRLA